MKIFFLGLVFFIPIAAQARLLQIIHTNDLHSHFENYPKVLSKIKELRNLAHQKGIEVLQLDAGDWGDGTSFYLSDNGADSLRALELLGVDVTTLGNHDHMIGGKVLSEQIRRAKVSTKIAVANLTTTPEMNLENVISPFVDLEKAGIKIRVIGLTTSDDYFEYSMRPGGISSPIPVGEREAKAAKEAGREMVIALTHIGQWEDKELAQNSTAIDVIVGGHSHTKLSEIDWETNRNGKRIPIVQAWAHGLSVGSLFIDVNDSGEVKVLEYKLHEISSPIAPDPEMLAFIKASEKKRNNLFETAWDEIIGHTDTPIRGYKEGMPGWGRSCWGHHVARAIRYASGASVGINIAGFFGKGKPAGPVTFGDIVENMPHIRKFGDQGWEIATIFMQGWKLRPIMAWATRRGYSIDFSGLGYKDIPGEEEIDDKATYRIAIPAEIAVAIKGSLPQYREYLAGLKFTGKFFWPVMVDYVKKNSPINCE